MLVSRSQLLRPSLMGQPLLLKRERGSGERSYIHLSLWDAHGTIECDVDHKICISDFYGTFCSNLRIYIACVLVMLLLCTIQTQGGKDGNGEKFLFSLVYR